MSFVIGNGDLDGVLAFGKVCVRQMNAIARCIGFHPVGDVDVPQLHEEDLEAREIDHRCSSLLKADVDIKRCDLNHILFRRDHLDGGPQGQIPSFGNRDGAEEEIGDKEEDTFIGCCE